LIDNTAFSNALNGKTFSTERQTATNLIFNTTPPDLRTAGAGKVAQLNTVIVIVIAPASQVTTDMRLPTMPWHWHSPVLFQLLLWN